MNIAVESPPTVHEKRRSLLFETQEERVRRRKRFGTDVGVEGEQLPPGGGRVPFGERRNQFEGVHHPVQKRCRGGEEYSVSARERVYSVRAVHETLLKALKGLFPGMSDETIANVLEEFGEDVDAAIRRLNELQISNAVESKESEEQHEGTSQSADDWIDMLVQQMSMAKDVDDAKQRASEVLKGFEGVVLRHACPQGVESMQRENTLLKRAVGIQNSKIHELSEKCKNVDEMLLKFEELKEKCHHLELQNYSLQLHLKQATCQDNVAAHPNPDVF
mmetsp:Transcript_10464/g.20677  ORF Transcript_10464/g.20677 Transcript_10464/m.20677 type:complete len:276 (-) Transcript_10464:50-877(-)|eukprot:CAMPEP_0118799460 /NCGR_PEP_ID=MMETSP1161-20130426/1669_1 /TAXON_ID=249345 /ORGANISM="Picochlorum oklahomensis, Strain CCMP2329" /LENGTH=275 /DNA_ID=CAMNT_0006727161 /DNA_START=256 /DNA_END=1083 /DNA_ORIENTATION=-